MLFFLGNFGSIFPCPEKTVQFFSAFRAEGSIRGGWHLGGRGGDSIQPSIHKYLPVHGPFFLRVYHLWSFLSKIIPNLFSPHIRIFDNGQLPPPPLDDLGGSGTPKGGHIRGWGG